MSERPSEESTGVDSASANSSEADGCEGCEAAKGGGRRGFLFAAGTTLLTVGGGLAAVPIVGVAIGPAEAGDPNRWISLGKATDFKIGETVLVKFTNPWIHRPTATPTRTSVTCGASTMRPSRSSQ